MKQQQQNETKRKKQHQKENKIVKTKKNLRPISTSKKKEEKKLETQKNFIKSQFPLRLSCIFFNDFIISLKQNTNKYIKYEMERLWIFNQTFSGSKV